MNIGKKYKKLNSNTIDMVAIILFFNRLLAVSYNSFNVYTIA